MLISSGRDRENKRRRGDLLAVEDGKAREGGWVQGLAAGLGVLVGQGEVDGEEGGGEEEEEESAAALGGEEGDYFWGAGWRLCIPKVGAGGKGAVLMLSELKRGGLSDSEEW